MKMKKTLIAIAAMALLITATASFAQRGPGIWRGSGGWGPGSPYGKLYDPKTVQTITGEVLTISRITPRKGMSAGIHITVKTDKEAIDVHLGPSWYIENQDVKIEPKDTVQVKGSKVTLEGKPAIIAAEVHKGNEVLTLRDDAGFPIWSGWHRR